MLVCVICVGAVLGSVFGILSVALFGSSLLAGFAIYFATTMAFFGVGVAMMLRPRCPQPVFSG